MFEKPKTIGFKNQRFVEYGNILMGFCNASSKHYIIDVTPFLNLLQLFNGFEAILYNIGDYNKCELVTQNYDNQKNDLIKIESKLYRYRFYRTSSTTC